LQSRRGGTAIAGEKNYPAFQPAFTRWESAFKTKITPEVVMSKSTFYVGIDVGQTELWAAVEGQKPRSFSNTPTEVKKLWNWAKKLSGDAVAHFCMEATGVYGYSLAAVLHSYNDPDTQVSIVNPAQIAAFAKAQLRRAKTDKVDAQVILNFAQSQKPAAFIPDPKEFRQLYHLVAQTDTIRGQLQEWNNRAHTHQYTHDLPKMVNRSSSNVQKTLLKELDKLEKAIKKLCAENPDLDNMVKLLCSIPGFGHLSAVRLIAYGKKRLTELSQKELTAHAGLAPSPKQSGTSLNAKAHLSKQGNTKMRNSLYMPALVAARHNPIIKELYDRLLGKGKPSKVALTACMKKMLLIARAILISEIPFNPAFSA
jgi:transposase